MGQFVETINGISEACKKLDYPVVSGNVSLYNETNGIGINPTPVIGGIGLIKDLNKSKEKYDLKKSDNGKTYFIKGSYSLSIGDYSESFQIK